MTVAAAIIISGMHASAQNKTLLAIEFAALFIALPLAIAWLKPRTAIIPLLWIVATGCLAALWLDRSFDRRVLWQLRGAYDWLPGILLRFAAGAALLTIMTIAIDPHRFLSFPLTRPGLYATVLTLYPFLSVYPQGLVYRGFVFHRYRNLFGDDLRMVLASAVAFGFGHIVLLNWIAPLFTFIGRLLFALTYRRSRSLVLTSVEHALYGDFAFTVGIGWYFYGGSRFA